MCTRCRCNGSRSATGGPRTGEGDELLRAGAAPLYYYNSRLREGKNRAGCCTRRTYALITVTGCRHVQKKKKKLNQTRVHDNTL